MVRRLRWHCPPDTGFEIRALAVWSRARYLSVTEAPHNTNFHTWMGKEHFCFFQTAEIGNRTPDSGVKGSGANHYPRAPAPNSSAYAKWVCSRLVKYRGMQWSLGPAGTIRFILPQFVSYLRERGVLCVGNGRHFCTPVPMNMSNITFRILRLSRPTFVFNKGSEIIIFTIIFVGKSIVRA